MKHLSKSLCLPIIALGGLVLPAVGAVRAAAPAGRHTLLHDPAIGLSTNWMPERGTGVVNNLSTEASRGTWADIWRIEPEQFQAPDALDWAPPLTVRTE